MIDCLKRLTVDHKITTIVSIHQPNSDLFNTFDSIYVLAKGGVCVYSGPPSGLRQYLMNSEIEFNENQIPIEVLIKLSFKGIHNINVRKLSEKTEEIIKLSWNKSLIVLNNMEVMKNNSNKSSKSFSFVTF